MAKKEGYVVDINKLWRYDDTTGEFVAPKALWANGKEYYAAFSNGEITFNKANYELYLEDTTLVALADGTIVDPYVYYSRKTDFDGMVTEVEVTDTLGEIKPNYTDQDVWGNFSITQKTSNFELTGTYRQRKDSSNDEYYNLRITYIVCPLIPAGGGSRPLTIGYSVVRKRRYESGKLEEETINSTTTSFVEADVDTTDKSSFDASTGKLSGDSLLKDPTEESPIATVKYVKISLYGLTAEWRGSQSWNQEANTIEENITYEAWSYAEPDPSEDNTIGVEGGTILFHGRAYQRITGIWTSGEPADTTTITEPLYFSTNYGTFPNGSTRYTMMDEGTIELQVGSTDTDRIINVNVNNAYAGYSEEYRYRQSAKEFVGYNHFIGFMEALVGYEQAPAGGGSVAPSVTVYIKMCAEYSDGSYDESDWIRTTATNVRVTSASNATDDYKNMATLNKSNGVVTVNDLGTTEWKDVHTAFVVNSMSGLFDVGGGVYDRAWSWSGTAIVEQEENIKNYTGEVGYTYEADIQPDTLEGNDTIISVDYDAWQHTYYYWNSRPSNMLSDDVAQWLYIRITGAATASRDVKGSGTYTYDVGTVGTTDRTFNVAVTNNSGNVIASSSITQVAPTSFHYELVQVDGAGVSYEEAFAWANSVSPYIQVRAWFKKVWSNGTTDPNLVYEDHSVGESGFTISNAAGQAKNDSLATINSSTGVVSVKSLGTNRWEKPHDVFEVQSLYGTFKSALTNKSHGWQMTGTAMVEQAMNIPRDISNQDVYRVVDPEDMLSGDTTLYLAYQSENVIKQQWDSDRYGDYINTITTPLSMRIVVGVDYTGEKTVSGSGTATFPVGINSSTTSSRTFRVMAYDANNNTVANFNVVQAANILSWIAPVINGEFSVSNISAKGGNTTVRVPVKQYKVNTSGTPVEPIYTWWADALAIQGTPSNGGSTSGGVISAPNLGQTATSERTIFTITGVKIQGWDGNEHTIKVSPSVAVKQNANTKSLERSRYTVSISPQGNIPNVGGSIKLNVSAYEWVSEYWASAPETPTNETGYAMTGYVTAPGGGTITGSPITGTGKQVTFTYNQENVQSYQIGLTANLRAISSVGLSDITTSCQVLQNAVSFVLNAGENKECNATASTVQVSFESNRNGKPWEPTFSTDTSMATIGSITQSGTMFYVNVNVLENKNSSNRDIIVTATQTRSGGTTATATVTITQAAAAAPNLPLAGVVLGECMYTDDSLSNVRYSLYFTAKDTTKYQGGTLPNVVIQLNTKPNGSGSVLGTPRNLGDITVTKGTQSSTYSGTFNAGGRVAYLLVYWNNTLQFYTAVEEYIPE